MRSGTLTLRKRGSVHVYQERKPPSARIVCEFLTLFLVTSLYLAKVGISLYAWWGDYSSIGLDTTISGAIEQFDIGITPAAWTNAAWIVAYAFQGAWILFAWSFIHRQETPRTIFPGLYPSYMIACGLNIGLVFTWGNVLSEVSLALVVVLALVLYVAIGMVSVYLYKRTPALRGGHKIDFWLTHVLVLSGLVFYAAWITVVFLFNLGAVIQEREDVHPDTVGTVILSLLGAITVAYFLLENTILDRFLRYVHVFAVYPVVIWTLGGVLAEIWDSSASTRNSIFAVVLAGVVGLLFLIRVALLIAFHFVRAPAEYLSDEDDTIPFS